MLTALLNATLVGIVMLYTWSVAKCGIAAHSLPPTQENGGKKWVGEGKETCRLR